MVDRKADDVITTADGEGHAMTGVGASCMKDAISGGVVAGWVHGIGACMVERSLYLGIRMWQRTPVRLLTGKRTSRDWKDVIVMSPKLVSAIVASLGQHLQNKILDRR